MKRPPNPFPLSFLSCPLCPVSSHEYVQTDSKQRLHHSCLRQPTAALRVLSWREQTVKIDPKFGLTEQLGVQESIMEISAYTIIWKAFTCKHDQNQPLPQCKKKTHTHPKKTTNQTKNPTHILLNCISSCLKARSLVGFDGTIQRCKTMGVRKICFP